MACVRLWTPQFVTCRKCGRDFIVRDINVALSVLRTSCLTGFESHEPEINYVRHHVWAWRGRVSEWPEW
jgi:hypothetical protein